MSSNKNKRPLRSQAWFGGDDKDSFIHRSWMKNQGYPATLSMAVPSSASAIPGPN